MNILIVGGVAAGTKAAARLKRRCPDASVKLLTKSRRISYAGCALPYYVGGAIPDQASVTVNTPESFSALTGVQVITGCQVTAVDPAAHRVSALLDGEAVTESYDKLILATGAEPFVPEIPGVRLPGVFCLRTPEDAFGLSDYLQAHACRRAVIAGAGFIGLELAENLMARGLSVTVVDAASQILPGALDPEFADFAARRLRKEGLRLLTGSRILSVSGQDRASGIVSDAGPIPADVVILAIGIRPATDFLSGSGIALEKGAVLVDEQMRTNLPDIYAAGDCALVKNALTGSRQYSAMGSTANLTARLLANDLAGGDESYAGCLGTGVVRLLPDLNVGRTGLTEAQARAAGFDPVCVCACVDDKAHYYPGSGTFYLKLVADRPSRRLLGLQVLGNAVDKLTDLAALAVSQGLTLEAFDTLDLAYAPPFSTAIHPLTQGCYILENKLSGALETMAPAEYALGAARDYQVLDVHPTPTIPGARWIDLTAVTGPIDGLDKDAKLLLVCARGKRAYFLQNRLKRFGYTNTRVLEGGASLTAVRPQKAAGRLSDEEIKRVKGLGCLQDKRFPDRFNIRVITRNGKLTSLEQKAVADAAELFGSGEVAMTTRLTLEIQSVPYEKLEDAMDFLRGVGLETGGTGSKVRPVVSCKGTTCQYGLCDTYDLSQQLHQLFYHDYHGVTLPHKFKIAVGGCPNNCVKPDLNDLGVIGQRLPQPDLSKCRGCKVCQIVAKCPIHAASLSGGKLQIDPDACNHCGRCVGQCPFHALDDSISGYKITIGGRWGKKIAQGRPLDHLFTSRQEVLDMVEKTILFYRDEGITGERFADTIARLGFDYVEDKLLNGTLDKAAVLEKTVVGGAKC